MTQSPFWQRLVQWQQTHGRHHLPWQSSRDPYRVWLSEIMLQQTQVSTVVGYYARFLAAFPTVAALAQASQDEVLALWSGLGYYSRARNLHRCAQQVCTLHQGQFPRSAQQLALLPGIGPSTAAAIAAFCFGERISIFDANVQRVLARHSGFDQDLAQGTHRRALQAIAQARLPDRDVDATVMPAYTQGLMDLGATLCTARQAHCQICPVATDCMAKASGQPARYPVKTKKITRSAVAYWMLLVHSAQGIWLHKRPQQGIWAGLYAPPLLACALSGSPDSPEQPGPEPDIVHSVCGGAISLPFWRGAAFRHVLTHRDLYLHPIGIHLPDHAHLPSIQQRLMAMAPDGGWVQDWSALGLPAPVRQRMSDWLQALRCMPDTPDTSSAEAGRRSIA